VKVEPHEPRTVRHEKLFEAQAAKIVPDAKERDDELGLELALATKPVSLVAAQLAAELGRPVRSYGLYASKELGMLRFAAEVKDETVTLQAISEAEPEG
jgi:hypothetical protein